MYFCLIKPSGDKLNTQNVCAFFFYLEKSFPLKHLIPYISLIFLNRVAMKALENRQYIKHSQEIVRKSLSWQAQCSNSSERST